MVVNTPFNHFDPSLALARIVHIDANGITASTPDTLPPFVEIEALAQACGMHLRWLHDFQIQAYLVAVSGYPCPADSPALPMTITARLLSRTTSAASYAASTDNNPGCRILMGMRPGSDDTFFRNRFQCLSHF